MSTPRTTYATYFDVGYLPRGLTLIESLRAQGDESTICVLCLDEPSKTYLDAVKLTGVKTFSVDELEREFPELAPLKSERSRIEYVFSIGPTFLKKVMASVPKKTGLVIYLDADLYFFDDPQLVAQAMGKSSVGIIEHRYPPALEKKLLKYGRYNVGWVGFKNTAEGNQVLGWWADKCVEWCFDTPEPGRYADQGYLDQFPRFDGVAVLSSAGFDLAPWNTGRHQLTANAQGRVLVDSSDELNFFHFHGIKESGDWYITSQLVYGSGANKLLMTKLYQPYLQRLETNQNLVNEFFSTNKTQALRRGKGLRGALFAAKKTALTIASISTGNAVRKTARIAK